MKVAPAALARLRESPMKGEGVGTIFEAMAFGMEQTNTPCSMFTLDFQHPDDAVEPGQLIPVITLSLRPVVAQSVEP
jgi:hypothetical protein